jgi:hypothetical protein
LSDKIRTRYVSINKIPETEGQRERERMMHLNPNSNRKQCILYITVKYPRQSLCGKEGE